MNDDHSPENVAQTVADLMRSQADVAILPLADLAPLSRPFLVSVPEGRQVQDFTLQLRAAQSLIHPLQRKGTAKMTTLASVIDWANRFKGENSVLYAKNSGEAPSLTCIADYHLVGPAVTTETGDPTARHGHHRASYAFPLSKQWQVWRKLSGQPVTGMEMGVFLEDNILDIIDPPLSLTSPGIRGAEANEAELRLIEIAQRLDGSYGTGAQLLAMAKSFTVYETSDFVETRNSTSGEASLMHKTEHTDGTGQPIRVPKLFLIAIPVFENGPAYRLPVRFQYRKSGSSVKFILTLHDPKNAIDHAFAEALDVAMTETGLPLFIGDPEA